MLKGYIIKFSHALRGIADAVMNDVGFRTQVYLGAALLFIVSVWFTPISSLEVLMIIMAYSLVLITELQNSALEITLDKIHPERDKSIGRAKDMTAGAVLIAGLFLLFTLTLVYFFRI